MSVSIRLRSVSEPTSFTQHYIAVNMILDSPLSEETIQKAFEHLEAAEKDCAPLSATYNPSREADQKLLLQMKQMLSEKANSFKPESQPPLEKQNKRPVNLPKGWA